MWIGVAVYLFLQDDVICSSIHTQWRYYEKMSRTLKSRRRLSELAVNNMGIFGEGWKARDLISPSAFAK